MTTNLHSNIIQHSNLTHLNHYLCLIVTLMVTPLLKCSFAAFISLISHDQFPSGLVARLLEAEQRSSVPEVVVSNPTDVRAFFSFFVWAHFFCRDFAQKVLIYGDTSTYHI